MERNKNSRSGEGLANAPECRIIPVPQIMAAKNVEKDAQKIGESNESNQAWKSFQRLDFSQRKSQVTESAKSTVVTV